MKIGGGWREEGGGGEGRGRGEEEDGWLNEDRKRRRR